MGIGVGGSIKDGVPVKEQLEAAKISAHGEHGQQSCDGKESPLQGNDVAREKRPASARELPAMNRKRMASAQPSTDSVSSHPAINCHAGRAKR